MAGETGELDAEIAGQKVSLKNVSINTMATVATLLGVCMLVYILIQHEQESKQTASMFVSAVKEQTTAVKDQTVALREQTCIVRFKEAERQQQAEFCKQIAR